MLNGTQVEALEELMILDHGNNDWWNDVQIADLVLLNGPEVSLHFEFGQNDNAVTTVCTGMANDDETIDMRHGENAKCHVSVAVMTLTPPFLVTVREL
jgi:hypothetical protein